MAKKSNTQEFTEKAKLVHGNKFDYSKVDYVNTRTKVIITCPNHGYFKQTPINHLSFQGCPDCAIDSTKSNTQEFTEKAKSIHGDKFDYSKVDYVNTRTKVIITCPNHGDFKQTPKNHLQGYGCLDCASTKKSNTQEFIEKAKFVHGDKFDYSKVDYVNNRTKIIITCPNHGDFKQRPDDHLHGYGCSICAIDSTKYNTQEFIEKAREIHGDKYGYGKVDYVNNRTKIIIICPYHGDFEQAPRHHLSGSGCPICRSSKGEIKIRQFLTQFQIQFLQEHKFPDCRHINPLPFDFYLPEHNICIEYQGEYHFQIVNYSKDPKKNELKLKDTQKRDLIKRQWCFKNKIHLIEIPFWEENIEQILTQFVQ